MEITTQSNKEPRIKENDSKLPLQDTKIDKYISFAILIIFASLFTAAITLYILSERKGHLAKVTPSSQIVNNTKNTEDSLSNQDPETTIDTTYDQVQKEIDKIDFDEDFNDFSLDDLDV